MLHFELESAEGGGPVFSLFDGFICAPLDSNCAPERGYFLQNEEENCGVINIGVQLRGKP
jgi:hypothetical protein